MSLQREPFRKISRLTVSIDEGVAYILLDQPKNPPPPVELGLKPNRPYVPWTPSPFTMVQDRLPVLLDQADATLETLREIVARMPESL